MADLSKLRFNGTDYNVKDASAPLRKFTNYSKTGNLPITSDDTTQTAIGKLEKALDNKINTSAKGTSNGVAELDANGKVPSSQLPSFVDDVLEYSAKSSFPATGETGKIYVDTSNNKTYRWSGSAYVEISESLALGETSSTAYRGDRGKAAYDHSQITNGNPHGTTGANTNLTGYSKGSSKDAVAATDTVNAAIAKHENRINANQSNILSVLNRTGKNIVNIQAPTSLRGCTFVEGNNGAVTITNTENWSQFIVNAHVKPNTQYKLVFYTDAISNLPAFDVYPRDHDTEGSSLGANFRVSNTGTIVKDFTSVSDVVCLNIYPDNQATTVSGTATIRVMICEKTLYDLSNEYTWGIQNYDLTRLEAEDRAALAEEIDAGAKNLFEMNATNVSLSTETDYSVTGSTFQVTSSTSWSYTSFIIKGNFDTTKTYVLSFRITAESHTAGSTESEIRICPTNLGGNPIINPHITGTGTYAIEFKPTSSTLYLIMYANPSSNSSLTNSFTVTDVMICTKAAFGVSNKFVPFGNDPFYEVPINHNMIYRGRNLGASLTDAQHTALSSGNFTDLYLGDYWTKTVTIPAGTYTGGDGKEVTVPAQTNITLKAVIADFDTFYVGYASYAGINTHHAAVIVTGFSNVVWNKTNSTAGGYVASLIHKWLVGSALPQIRTWFGSAKVLSHQKLLTNAITGDAASGWAWSSQKIALLSENQMYGSKVWGNSKAANGGYEPGEAFKHLNVFNHIDANLLFGNRSIWLRDIASAVCAARLGDRGDASYGDASYTWVAPAALILLS